VGLSFEFLTSALRCATQGEALFSFDNENENKEEDEKGNKTKQPTHIQAGW